MGLWEIFQTKKNIRDDLEAKARILLEGRQEGSSCIERDYQTNIKMQEAAREKITQMGLDEQAGHSYMGAHKVKRRYEAVADSLSHERSEKYGELLPNVQSEVDKMRAFIKKGEPEPTLERFQQGYQDSAAGAGFNPENLFCENIRHPAGFDEMKAIWNRCAEIEGEAAEGNLSKESRAYLQEAIRQLCAVGLKGEIPYRNPLEKDGEKTGIDFLLDSGHLGLLCGAIRNALLQGMYAKVKDLDTTELKVEEFSKLLIQKQVFSLITHRINISDTYKNAVQEYLHPKKAEPEKKEKKQEEKKQEPVKKEEKKEEKKKEEKKKEEPIKKEKKQEEKKQEEKKQEPVKKEVEKPKTELEAALKSKEEEIPESEKWLKDLTFKSLLPKDLNENEEEHSDLKEALDFYDYIKRYMGEKKKLSDLDDDTLKQLFKNSRWYSENLKERSMVMFLEERHPRILDWIAKESMITYVVNKSFPSMGQEQKNAYHDFEQKLSVLRGITYTVLEPLEKEYKQNKNAYKKKEEGWKTARKEKEAEDKIKREKYLQQREKEIDQVMIGCDDDLSKMGEFFLKRRGMEKLLRTAKDFRLGLKPGTIEEHLSSITTMVSEMKDWQSPLKPILTNPASCKYMLKFHPYVTRTIARYLQLLTFQNEYNRIEKEEKLGSFKIPKRNRIQIRNVLKENEKLIEDYEKEDWLNDAEKVLRKATKKRVFLIPEEKEQKNAISEAENKEQKTAEQIDDEKRADEYAKKEREAEIQAIKDAYPAEKDYNVMVIYHRLGALLGCSLHLTQNKKGYTLLENLEKERFTYTPEAMAKMIKIRDLDRLLGITRTSFDRWVKIQKPIEKGEPAVIEDVMVADPVGFMANRKLKIDWDSSLHMDRDFATKLLDLHDSDLQLLLGDVLDEEERMKLSTKLKSTQETLKQGVTELIEKEDYEDESRLELIISSFHTTSFQEAKNVTLNDATGESRTEEYYKKKKEYPAVKHSEKLKGWFVQAKKQIAPSQSMKETIDAVQKYYEAVDKNWGSRAYYQAHKEMMDAFRKWKSSEESAKSESFRELSDAFILMYGKNIFQKPADTIRMQDAREECRLQDEMNLRYAKYHYQESLRKAEEKGKGERYKEKHPEPTLVDRSGEPLFPHKPCAEDIKQGELGDCFLMAALMAAVRTDPYQILNCMDDLGDMVKVSFVEKTVYVSKKICPSCSARDTLWVQIMEKAYAMLQEADDENDRTGADYMVFADKLLKDLGFDTLKPEKKDAKLKELFAHTNHHLDSGGHSSKAYKAMFKEKVEYEYKKHNIQLKVYEEFEDGEMTLTEEAYSELWDLAVEEQEINQKRKKLKELLKEKLKDKLMAELEYRLGTVETLATKEKHRTAYRALTVDDLSDTLKDIKNWKNQKGRPVFYDLLVAVQKIFPEIKEEELKEVLNQLGEDFMKAGMHTKGRVQFGYRCRMEPNATICYTTQALERYQEIQKLLGDKPKEKLIFAETSQFLGDGSGGGLHDAGELDGLVMGHAYILTGYKEQDGHKFITLRNPWGTGEVFYAERTRADQSKYNIGKQHFDKETGGGEFDLELNDFMNKIEWVYCLK